MPNFVAPKVIKKPLSLYKLVYAVEQGMVNRGLSLKQGMQFHYSVS